MINNPFIETLTVILLIVSLLAGSCAKTRTITPLTQSNRSNIERIAILVEADKELDASVGTSGYAEAAAVLVWSSVFFFVGGFFINTCCPYRTP